MNTSEWGAAGGDARVMFGKVPFVTGYDPAHHPGWFATLIDLEGWDDDAPDVTDSMPHWGGQGTIAGQDLSGGRVIRMRGRVRATAPHLAERGKRALKAARGILAVAMPGDIAMEADARRSGIAFDRMSPTVHEFTMTLIADDPLRYSADVQVLANGENVLVNQGDRESWPVLELAGPHSAMTITHAGGVWNFAANTAATVRTVSLRDGDVWLGGARVFGLDSGAAPSLPPGISTWQVSGLGSAGALVRRFAAFS